MLSFTGSSLILPCQRNDISKKRCSSIYPSYPMVQNYYSPFSISIPLPRIIIKAVDETGETSYSQPHENQLNGVDLHKLSDTKDCHSSSTPDVFISKPYSPIEDKDREEVDSITMRGEQQLDEVAEQVRTDMKNLETFTESNADKIIEQETQALLNKYQDQQTDLIEAVGREREVIQEEITELMDLASSTKKRPPSSGSGNTTVQILQAATLLFGLASVIYAFGALAESDSSAMINSLIDAAVAVCSAYFLSKTSTEDK